MRLTGHFQCYSKHSSLLVFCMPCNFKVQTYRLTHVHVHVHTHTTQHNTTHTQHTHTHTTTQNTHTTHTHTHIHTHTHTHTQQHNTTHTYMMEIISKHRSEEHTSELQSHLNLVCRLL